MQTQLKSEQTSMTELQKEPEIMSFFVIFNLE